MGLGSKHVHDNQDSWDRTLLQSAESERSKPLPSAGRQQEEQFAPLKCPRCCSANTKFCYFNNYNRSQPRHFCKSCKRHWTEGGTLRNVPVGGGRKSKRPKISNIVAAPATATLAAVQVTAASSLESGSGFSVDSGDQKFRSNPLYQTLIQSSSAWPLITSNIDIKPFMGSNRVISATGLNTEVQLPGLNTYNMNASFINHASYNILNAYDQQTNNPESTEESTITTDNIPSTSKIPLLGADNSSIATEVQNYWNWNEIDLLTSFDINFTW